MLIRKINKVSQVSLFYLFSLTLQSGLFYSNDLKKVFQFLSEVYTVNIFISFVPVLSYLFQGGKLHILIPSIFHPTRFTILVLMSLAEGFLVITQSCLACNGRIGRIEERYLTLLPMTERLLHLLKSVRNDDFQY